MSNTYPAQLGQSRKWRLLVTIPIGLLVLWMVASFWSAVIDLRDAELILRNGGSFYNGGGSNVVMAALFRRPWVIIVLDLWTSLAIGLLVLQRANPFHWFGARQIIRAGLAIGIIAGRFPLGWMDFLLAIVPFWLLVVAAPILMLLVGTVSIILTGSMFLSAVGLVIGVPMAIANIIFQFERNVAQFHLSSGIITRTISQFYFWISGETEPPARPDDSKGARFAIQSEIDDVMEKHPLDASVMGFGYALWSGNGRHHLVRIKTDKHILVMASTRSGKGASLIIPHLLRYSGSAFVLDPKGENAKATSRHRATLNEKVHVLDPFGISGKPRSRFNPLSRFTSDNMEAASKALAAAMVVVEGERRDHWLASGQQLVATMILYVYASPDFPPETKDLTTVRRLLLGAVPETLRAIEKTDLADGLLANLARSFIKTPENEFGSIVSTAQRQTEILDNPYIAACLKATGPGEEVDFSVWHGRTMTVFLCLSAVKFPEFNRWLRLVLTSALNEMTDQLQPPPIPVSFVLDELATLGHLPIIENAVGLSAGYGIQLMTVFQDVGQMRALYRGRWASFINNSGVRVLFNLDDHETAAYWSNFLGSREISTTSSQLDQLGFVGGQNQATAIRPLLSPDGVMLRYADTRMLILAQGARPLEVGRRMYFEDESLDGLWDDPRTEVRPLSLADLIHVGTPTGPQPAAPMPDLIDDGDEDELPAPADVPTPSDNKTAEPGTPSGASEIATRAAKLSAALGSAGSSSPASPRPKPTRPQQRAPQNSGALDVLPPVPDAPKPTRRRAPPPPANDEMLPPLSDTPPLED